MIAQQQLYGSQLRYYQTAQQAGYGGGGYGGNPYMYGGGGGAYANIGGMIGMIGI